MGRTLIPTGGLRYALKGVPVPGYDNVTRKAPVLQQRYTDANSGRDVWIDVPTVDEQEDGA